MTAKDLKKLSRQELLELLIEQSSMIEEIQNELKAAQENLEKRSILMEKSGTMAEAALTLNGVFDAVDQAAKEYLENIKALSDAHAVNASNIENETRARCEKVLAEANARAQEIVARAEEDSRMKKKAADDYMRAIVQSAAKQQEKIQRQPIGVL